MAPHDIDTLRNAKRSKSSGNDLKEEEEGRLKSREVQCDQIWL